MRTDTLQHLVLVAHRIEASVRHPPWQIEPTEPAGEEGGERIYYRPLWMLVVYWDTKERYRVRMIVGSDGVGSEGNPRILRGIRE